MAWCKTGVSDDLGEIFFSSKVPEFLHGDFNALENHGHVPFFADVSFGFEKLRMQKKKYLLLRQRTTKKMSISL